jgi:hypothetical protein
MNDLNLKQLTKLKKKINLDINTSKLSTPNIRILPLISQQSSVKNINDTNELKN